MIIGAHSILYSARPEADRAFLRDVLSLPSVDVGEGWLIFGLPPSEVAIHPSEVNDVQEFYLMCDDVERFVAEMTKRNVACAPARHLGWGILTQVTLPRGRKTRDLSATASAAEADGSRQGGEKRQEEDGEENLGQANRGETRAPRTRRVTGIYCRGQRSSMS